MYNQYNKGSEEQFVPCAGDCAAAGIGVEAGKIFLAGVTAGFFHVRASSCCRSTAIKLEAMGSPVTASISRKQVGLVTLISVKQSPMTSRPTKYNPRFLI